MKTIYRSKISWWLVILICIVSLLPILPIICCDLSWVEVSILSLLWVFIFYCIFSNRYIIEGNILNIKCGFFINEKVNIMDIIKIVPTNSFLAAPAASLDRIAIYLKKQRSPVVISPKNKYEFINQLKSINPDIICNGF